VFPVMPAEEQRALLAHELAHLVRRDPVWFAVASVIARAMFVQPLNRTAGRKLREASEQAADDEAVRVTGNPAVLARALAGLTSIVMALGGTAAANGSPIVERVRRLVDPRPAGSAWAGPRCHVLAALVVTGVVLLAPGLHLPAKETANRIAWLTPSREAPNARMLEVRETLRAWRHALREVVP
jgi:beta-lactamase regulating signal transducer with metallopeptidase domain